MSSEIHTICKMKHKIEKGITYYDYRRDFAFEFN